MKYVNKIYINLNIIKTYNLITSVTILFAVILKLTILMKMFTCATMYVAGMDDFGACLYYYIGFD